MHTPFLDNSWPPCSLNQLPAKQNSSFFGYHPIDILKQVNVLAKNLNISRNCLFVLVAQEFIQRRTNKELLRAINEAYDDLPIDDKNIVEKMRPGHLKMVKDQW